MLKPLPTSTQKVEVVAAIDEVPQLLARLPDAEVDNHVVVERASGGGVVRSLGGIAPDETGRLLGQGIDRVEPVHEGLKLGGIERRHGPADVEDGQVMRPVHTRYQRHTARFYVNSHLF